MTASTRCHRTSWVDRLSWWGTASALLQGAWKCYLQQAIKQLSMTLCIGSASSAACPASHLPVHIMCIVIMYMLWHVTTLCTCTVLCTVHSTVHSTAAMQVQRLHKGITTVAVCALTCPGYWSQLQCDGIVKLSDMQCMQATTPKTDVDVILPAPLHAAFACCKCCRLPFACCCWFVNTLDYIATMSHSTAC